MNKEKESIEYAEQRVREINKYPGYSMYRQMTLTKFDGYDLASAYEDGWDKARQVKASTPLTTEILERSGFKDCKTLNLSPDYYIDTPEFTISVILRDSCDTKKGIWITRKSDHLCINLELDHRKRENLYVEQLQGLLGILGLNLEIKYE